MAMAPAAGTTEMRAAQTNVADCYLQLRDIFVRMQQTGSPTITADVFRQAYEDILRIIQRMAANAAKALELQAADGK